jgi:Tol biopolymer transport system component
VLAGRAIRRGLVAAALGSLLAAATAGAAAPAGPRLAVIKETWRPNRVTLLSVNPSGGDPRRLAGGQENGGPIQAGRMSWRPDGSEIAFQGIRSIFLARAGGGWVHELNIADAERPVFAPDGNSLVFTRLYGPEVATGVWIIDLESGKQRRLLRSRGRIEYVGSSISADGTTLLVTKLDYSRGGGEEVLAVDLVNGGARRLIGNGFSAAYSPDGSRVAFLRGAGKQGASDLFVLDLTSRSLHRLTRTPHKEELFPSWDPSGNRIAFSRHRRGRIEWANSVHQINADGSCEVEVFAVQRRITYYAPTWQPGPGREAGPIEC